MSLRIDPELSDELDDDSDAVIRDIGNVVLLERVFTPPIVLLDTLADVVEGEETNDDEL